MPSQIHTAVTFDTTTTTFSTEAGPTLPAGLAAYPTSFENWSGETTVDTLWGCSVSSPDDVVALANWAYENSYRLRPRGHSHNWSPLTLAPGTGDRVLLVDTTNGLNAIAVNDGPLPSVTAQAGASMEDVLGALEQHGYGLTHHPAPGDITVGGALAIGGHGTAIPAAGETRSLGGTFGSLSNLMLSMTAVVWDAVRDMYVLRTFARTDPEAGALAVHLGRAFITEVTLRAAVNSRIRCQSRMDIPAVELFAGPGCPARTFDSFLNESGRVEAIWFPFTAYPWLKVWTNTPHRPGSSREVHAPFNYPFSDQLSPRLTWLLKRIQTGVPWLAPAFGKMCWASAVAGLAATKGWDLWGWAKNTTLYVRPSTLRYTANGYAILCRRGDVQRVIHEFVTYYQSKVTEYHGRQRYPMNGPVEIRVTGLDQPDDVGIEGAQPVLLSPIRPRPDHPEWDCAVWLDILTFPRTPSAAQFYREMEQWCLANYSGDYASLRVEWSKGWGYTDEAAWSDAEMLDIAVPSSLSDGQPVGQRFADAQAILNDLDPHRIYSSPLLNRLLG